MNEVEKDTSLKGCNISTDRLYTSVSPAKWLLDRNITTVGTLNTVRIGIPDELKNTKCRENSSVSFHIKSKEKNLYITTYSVKTKSTGRKNVLMLSAMRPIPRKTKDDGKSKPAIMKFYDFTKGGNKIVDQFAFFININLQLKIIIIKKYIHQTSRNLRMPGTNLKTIKFNNI